jgi:hypothetical protein
LHASAHVHCSESAQLRSARPTPSLCTFDVPCMSIFLIYNAIHALASMPSNGDSNADTPVGCVHGG